MAYGIIGYQQPNVVGLPSGSIWGDCQSQELLDESTGLFINEDFDVYFNPVTTVIPNLPSAAYNSVLGSVAQLADGNFDSALKIVTGANTNSGFSVFTQPLGAPLQAGNKLWMEANIAFNSSTAIAGGFVGFISGPVNQYNGSAYIVQAGALPAITAADAVNAKAGVLAQVSATRATNNISTGSLFGFLITPTGSGNQLLIDAVTLNQPTFSATPTPLPATTSTNTSVGALVTIASDLLNQIGAITANLPPGQSSLGQLNVAGSSYRAYTTGTSSNLAAYNAAAAYGFGFIKLGVRFDGSGKGGYGTLYWYVEGVQIASTVVSTIQDVISDYAPIVSFTSAVASQPFYLDWFRAASKFYIP